MYYALDLQQMDPMHLERIKSFLKYVGCIQNSLAGLKKVSDLGMSFWGISLIWKNSSTQILYVGLCAPWEVAFGSLQNNFYFLIFGSVYVPPHPQIIDFIVVSIINCGHNKRIIFSFLY